MLPLLLLLLPLLLAARGAAAQAPNCTVATGQVVAQPGQGVLCAECNFRGNNFGGGLCNCTRAEFDPELACLIPAEVDTFETVRKFFANASCAPFRNWEDGWWREPPSPNTADLGGPAPVHVYGEPSPPIPTECLTEVFGPPPGTVTASQETRRIRACNEYGGPAPAQLFAPGTPNVGQLLPLQGRRLGEFSPWPPWPPGRSLEGFVLPDTTDLKWTSCGGHGTWNPTLHGCQCSTGWKLRLRPDLPTNPDTGQIAPICWACEVNYGPPVPWDIDADGRAFSPPFCDRVWTPDPAPRLPGVPAGVEAVCSGHGDWTGEIEGCRCHCNSTHGCWDKTDFARTELRLRLSGDDTYAEEEITTVVKTCITCFGDFQDGPGGACTVNATASPTFPTLPVPTFTPTALPVTSAPSTSPTKAPTKAPTKSPTTSPTTSAPTSSPTTSAPTTSAPTKSPTTSAPTTSAPTTSPTTSAPTTSAPTVSPTTSAPTVSPTASPTDSPTATGGTIFLYSANETHAADFLASANQSNAVQDFAEQFCDPDPRPGVNCQTRRALLSVNGLPGQQAKDHFGAADGPVVSLNHTLIASTWGDLLADDVFPADVGALMQNATDDWWTGTVETEGECGAVDAWIGQVTPTPTPSENLDLPTPSPTAGHPTLTVICASATTGTRILGSFSNYGGTSVWRSNDTAADGTAIWEYTGAVTSNLRRCTWMNHPVSGPTFFLTGMEVWYSTDDGLTWTENPITGGNTFWGTAHNGSHVMIGATSGVVFFSAGPTLPFTQVTDPGNPNQARGAAYGNGRWLLVYAGGSGGGEYTDTPEAGGWTSSTGLASQSDATFAQYMNSGNGRFIVVSTSVCCVQSTDGSSFSTCSGAPSVRCEAVAVAEWLGITVFGRILSVIYVVDGDFGTFTAISALPGDSAMGGMQMWCDPHDCDCMRAGSTSGVAQGSVQTSTTANCHGWGRTDMSRGAITGALADPTEEGTRACDSGRLTVLCACEV